MRPRLTTSLLLSSHRVVGQKGKTFSACAYLEDGLALFIELPRGLVRLLKNSPWPVHGPQFGFETPETLHFGALKVDLALLMSLAATFSTRWLVFLETSMHDPAEHSAPAGISRL